MEDQRTRPPSVALRSLILEWEAYITAEAESFYLPPQVMGTRHHVQLRSSVFLTVT